MADTTAIDIGELAKQSGPWAAVVALAMWRFGRVVFELAQSWLDESRLRVERQRAELDAARELKQAARSARTRLDGDGDDSDRSVGRRRAQSTRTSGIHRRNTDAPSE